MLINAKKSNERSGYRKLTVGYDPNRRIGLEQMLGVDFFAGLEAADTGTDHYYVGTYVGNTDH